MPMLSIQSDEYFMKEALKEAKIALIKDEVPIGAVIVYKNKIVARTYNQIETLRDTTAHAEILAITSATNFLNSKYLNECTIYITLEPCVMCAGALYWSQVGKVVFGAADDKRGFMRYGKELLHPQTKLEYGILHDECSKLIQEFFRNKRK